MESKPLDFDAIEKEIQAGYISQQWHPSAPLRILNYTQRAQFDWRWNTETRQCRGLIVNDKNEVVARPFEKFFSYEQLNGIVPNEPFEVFEKYDGSLGILYFANGEPLIASRGSFTSTQAYRATDILHRKYKHVQLDQQLTYLCEILFPENRIVVNYGDMEDIVLLAIIETATGIERPLVDIGLPLVKKYDGITDFSEVLAQQDNSREGFVVRFSSGQRVKIKFEEYKRLHKLLTGVSPKQVWELLRAGSDRTQFLERVPDEFMQWFQKTEAGLQQEFNAIKKRAVEQFLASPVFTTRKEQALFFQQREFPHLMFALLDNKPITDQIWKMIRPVKSTAFRCDVDL